MVDSGYSQIDIYYKLRKNKEHLLEHIFGVLEDKSNEIRHLQI